jgi:GntR family transcriptional regulator
MVQPQGSALPGSRISVPLYGQVLGVLRQRIVDGVYAVGDQLQPEDQLAAEFAVSRATVRQAVGELVRQGLVDRKQGRGTFVLPVSQNSYGQRFSGSLQDLIAEIQKTKSIATDVQHGAAIPSRIAQELGLDQPVATVVRRTRAMDKEPFAYTINYMPDRFGRLVSEAELKKTGLMALLASKGVRFGSAQQLIRAEQADIEVCERLQMEFASPVLYVERLVLTVDDEPAEFVKSWYRADKYEYRVSLKADDGDGDRKLQKFHLA